ncbi:MAG: hypothetical protein R3308_02365, partial [Thiohalobacterales bacterium]|nr:hypothetical protein [Thiohalobacterales bacterium]
LDAEDAPSAVSLIGQAHREFSDLAAVDTGLEEIVRLLGEAAINIQEAVSLLRQYSDRLEIDPQRLHWLEERIALLHDLARKHGCSANELPAIEQQLQAELESLEHADEQRAALAERLAGLAAAWQDAADKLSRKRTRAAGAFSREITAAMQTLGMVGGVFEATVSRRPDGTPAPHGQDDIVFRVSANKGQPLQPLARVASGGELSRISLSIQVISAGSETIPTLIFDEVDSGIGGSVAEIVGRKLRALAGDRQVLCVTHLPQVAALAHQQLLVTKHTDDDTTHTRVTRLDEDRRIEELARMLGGVKITRQTREHAREMMRHAVDSPKTSRRKASRAGA